MKQPIIGSNEELDSMELDHENMLALMPGHVYWKDTKGILRGCNNTLAKTLKLKSRKDIIGKTDYDISSKSEADAIRLIDQEVITKGIEQINEEPYVSPDGLKCIYLTQRTPIFNNQGKVIGLIGISFDITERKKLEASLISAKEAAEAGNKAKTEFLANMRHDIRTPLSGIVGFSELLKSESNEPRIQEYADNLVASSHALLELMDEVLEAVRVSSGEIPMLKRKFNLSKTIEQIVALNQARAHEKKLKLSFTLDKGLPNFVIGDKIRLHRIALELIGNALNFTDNGHVNINITLAKKKHRELIIKMTVTDTGIGIPKEKQQDIYLQFKRLTPSYQGIYKGVGLGLYVVKQFIDELGGEIYVESEMRRGTVFTCLIPLQEPLIDDALGLDEDTECIIEKPLESTYAQEIKPTVATKDEHIFRVLIVEDNPIAQTVAKSILSKLRCDTDIADTGKNALELWKKGQYDLIFMDIGLPDMDGYEVTHQIRLFELTQKTHSPIIALTAHAGDENKQRCIEAGMNAVLTKPLTVASCTDILDAFIPGYQSRHNTSQEAAHRSDLPEKNESLFDLTSYPILDIEEGIKTAGTVDILTKMLHFMVQDSLLPDVQLLKEAHDEMNWETTQQIAHKIKGGAVYVGTVKLKMACQYLERYWKSGQRELLEPLYQQTLVVIDESIKEINFWLKSH